MHSETIKINEYNLFLAWVTDFNVFVKRFKYKAVL
jgi:hypothetical protein